MVTVLFTSTDTDTETLGPFQSTATYFLLLLQQARSLFLVSFVFASDLVMTAPESAAASLAMVFEVNCGFTNICFTARKTKPNFVPQAAKLPVQNGAEYYHLCYGLGASKGQLDHRKGERAANSLHQPP